MSDNFYKYMQWDITQRCNLKCAHCRSEEFYNQRDEIQDLSLEANKKIVEELYVNGVRRIHFLGGEPLIRRDFCDLAEFVDQLGIVWSVNTNATLLTEEVIQRILDANVHVVTISVDGPNALTNDTIRGRGVYDKIVANTKRLTQLVEQQNKETRVVILCTLMAPSLKNSDITEMTDVAQQLQADSLILSNLRKMGRARSSDSSLCLDSSTELASGERFARQIAQGNSQHIQLSFLTPICIQYINEKYQTRFPFYDGSCSALINKGYVQPDGAVFPCQSLTDVARVPASIGPIPRRSLVDYDFDEVWNSGKYVRIRKALFDERLDEQVLPCRYCRYYRVLCYPCPLAPIGGEKVVHHTCLEAMTKLAELRGEKAPWAEL